ncbi:MAG: hypothetical protein O3C34_03800, partial [Proteobacteria bacterium]|nr:hypothetical protein [Pseudomonadota bacterium]
MTGSFGKPNATGRSSGMLSGKARKMRSPPEGEPWVWIMRAFGAIRRSLPSFEMLNPRKDR